MEVKIASLIWNSIPSIWKNGCKTIKWLNQELQTFIVWAYTPPVLFTEYSIRKSCLWSIDIQDPDFHSWYQVNFSQWNQLAKFGKSEGRNSFCENKSCSHMENANFQRYPRVLTSWAAVCIFFSSFPWKRQQ